LGPLHHWANVTWLPRQALREFLKNGPKSRSPEFAETHPIMPTDHIEARWRHFRVESSILQKNRFSAPHYNLAPQEMALRVLCEIHGFRSFLALWSWPTGAQSPRIPQQPYDKVRFGFHQSTNPKNLCHYRDSDCNCDESQKVLYLTFFGPDFWSLFPWLLRSWLTVGWKRVFAHLEGRGAC